MNLVRVWMTIVMLSLILGPGNADAQKKKKVKTYRVVRADKIVGRFDMNMAKRDGEIFVVSAYYPGTKVLHASRPGTPTIRSYAELDSEGHLGRYKRWEKEGKTEPYWFTFNHDGNIRVRYEHDAGGKGQVKVLGPATRIAPIDGDMPQLAFAALSILRQERELSCAGVKPHAWGKVRIVKVGSVPVNEQTAANDPESQVKSEDGEKVQPAQQAAYLEHWRIEGDCGRFDVYLDGAGEPVRMVAGETNYELIIP